MKIIVADRAGFCFGVKRAIRMAEENAGAAGLVSLGPLIHNPQEIERLEKLGLKTREEGELDPVKGQEDTVLIRSHGVGPEVCRDLEDAGWRIVDATCPYVQKAQKLAEQAFREGYQVVILGDAEHAEVRGLKAWAGNSAIVVKSGSELEGVVLADKVALLAQTTEKEERFAELAAYLEDKAAEVRVLPTICKATRERQQAAAQLAEKADVMVVIGGRHSSNTQKLYEVCRDVNRETYLIEEASELNQQWFEDINTVGITAGASTPDWIIKEVIGKLDENKVRDEEQEANAIIEEPRNLQPGDMINGTIVSVSAEEVMVDIGGKAEAILPAAELSHRNVDPREMLSAGQEILVEIIKEDEEGNVILSHKKARSNQALQKLEEALETGGLISAPVVEVVKGGLLVDVGIRGFVPASQVGRAYVEDLSQFLHQELKMKVIELDRENNRAVLSQRAVLEEEHRQGKEAAFAAVTEGQIRKGTVSRLAKFGAFVDIGGVDGLLHVSEMSWARIEDPAELLKVGDEIEVLVQKIDREKEKISLSLRALQKSPWEEGIARFKPNMVVKGKVVRIVPFGAFIELEKGIEGLAHISQVSQKRVSKVEEVLKEGQEVEAKILEIDGPKKRISLSLKDIVTDRERDELKSYLSKQANDKAVTIGDIIRLQQEKKEK